MAKFAVLASILVLVSLAFAAPTKIRAGHAVPNAGSVDVYVDGNLVISNLDFGTVTDYTPLESGDHIVSISAGNATLLSQNITVSASPTTLLVLGLLVENSTAPVHFLPIVDDNSAPTDAASTRLKFVHASPETTPVEVFVDGTLAFGETSYGGVTTYAVVPAGQHNITVRVNANTSLEVPDLNLVGGSVYTIFAEGVLHPNNDTQGIRAVAIQDAAFTYFKLRVAHTVANAPAVTIKLRDDASNTTVEFPNVSYKQFSAYVNAVNGNYTVTVSAGAEVIFSTTPDFSGAANEATVAVVGRADVPANNSEYLNAVVFNDDNSIPHNGYARVKFVHTSPGAPAVDISANGNTLFNGIAYGTQSTYAPVAAGYYHIQVKAGAAVALNVAGLEFVEGQVYSIYAEGWLTGNDTHALTAVPNVDAVYQYVTFRIVTAVYDTPDLVTVALNGNVIGNFTAISLNNYMVQVAPTAFKFDVIVNGKTHTFNTPLTAGVYQSVIIAGRTEENTTIPVSLTVTQDDISFPPAGNLLKSKFIHASPGAPAVDVKVNGELLITNVAYLQNKVATWTETVGPVNISIYVTGTETLVYSTVLTQSYLFGGIFTIVAYGIVGVNSTQPFGILYQTDFNWDYSSVRVAHLVSDAAAVDLTLYTGATLIKSFPVNYNTISQYVQLPFLTSVTAVLSTGTTILLVQPVSYSSANPVTVAALGLSSSIAIYAFNDDNSAPSSSLQGRVRIIHAVPNAPAVNITFNDLQLFSNVAYGVPSEYISLEVANYRVDVYPLGSSAPAFSGFAAVTGGDVVTIVLEGDATKPDSLKVFPIQDAAYQYFRLRLVHAAPNAGAVNVLLDGTSYPATTGLEYTNITAFLDLPWSAGATQVSVVSGNTTVLEESFTFTVNKDITVAVAGNEPNVTYSFVSIPNDYVVPPNGATFATVQFAHLVALAPGVDVYLNHTKIAENVTYSHRSQYQQNIPTGEVLVEVKVAGGNDTIYQTNVDLKAEQVYTIYAIGVAGVEISAIVSNDYAPLPEFRIRVLHSSPNSGPLDVLVGSQLFFNKVEYKHASDYSGLNEGHYDLVVKPFDNVTFTLFKISQQNLKENMDYTFLLGGIINPTENNTADNFTGSVLVDDNTLPAEGKIAVRFIHAVIGISHVDLKFGTEVVSRNVSFLQASNYTTHDAAVIEISVVPTGSDTPIFPSASFDLKTSSAAVYTIVAQGEYPNSVTISTYLDTGGSPPPQQSSSKKHHGLTGLQIGLIIGGVALFVILVAGVAFVIYTKRRQLRGYSEIPSNKE